MPMRKTILLLLLALLLGACSTPVPAEKSAFVGEWQSADMYLLITQSGSVRYHRVKGGVSTSVNAPLKGFDGDNFTVGLGPMSTTFVVARPPHRDADTWKMEVDGVELTKTR